MSDLAKEGSPAPTSPSLSPTLGGVAKMYDLFPNTKPAVGKYVGVISGLLRNLAPRDVLASGSTFNINGAVHDAPSLDAVSKEATSPGSPPTAGGVGVGAGGAQSPASSPSRLPLDLLHSLCEDARDVFVNEPVIINVKVEPTDRLVLVGDIHGQFRDLQQHVLSLQRGVGDLQSVDGVDCKYLFLGDYVDRGPQGVEVITLLLALKVEYPANVFMIRGNHEDAQVSRLYGFLAECKSKLEIPSWGQFNEVFNMIPLGATVACEEGNIFCCHGGLSPTVEDVSALQFLNRVEYSNGLCGENSEAIDGLLWSDPGEHNGFRRNMRGCGHTFGTDTTARFCAHNELAFVARAHQMVMEGYQWEHNHRLLTLFSAPNYCGINNNKGAIAVIMGSEAHKKHLAAKAKAKAATTAGADTMAAEDAAAAEEEAAKLVACGIKIPMAFYSFTSAPASPCTLYYYCENPEGSAVIDATPDANGSPTMPSLRIGGSLPRHSALTAEEEGGDSAATSTAATPRPTPNPALALDGLQYFAEEEKKDDKKETAGTSDTSSEVSKENKKEEGQ